MQGQAGGALQGAMKGIKKGNYCSLEALKKKRTSPLTHSPLLPSQACLQASSPTHILETEHLKDTDWYPACVQPAVALNQRSFNEQMRTIRRIQQGSSGKETCD